MEHHSLLTYTKALALTMIFSSLSGCGGGGDSGPVTSTTSFPFRSALGAMVTNGFSKNYTISGSGCGTAIYTASPAIGGSTLGTQTNLFEVAETLAITATNCSGAPGSTNVSTSKTTYYTANYYLAGDYSASQYGVFPITYANSPSVMVGDTGNLGTENTYSDTSMAVLTSTTEHTYIVEPDTPNTAIINMVDKSFDSSHVLKNTAQSRYRISTSGPLTPLSINLDYGSGKHVIFQ